MNKTELEKKIKELGDDLSKVEALEQKYHNTRYHIIGMIDVYKMQLKELIPTE